MDIYSKCGVGGVVVEVVSDSSGSLKEEKVAKHSVLLQKLYHRTGVTAVLNFYLMTLGLVEVWDLPQFRPDANPPTSSPGGQLNCDEKVQKSLAGLIKCLESEGKEE